MTSKSKKIEKVVHEGVDPLKGFELDILKERLKLNKITEVEESPVVIGFIKRNELPKVERYATSPLPWRTLPLYIKWRSANRRHLAEIGAFRAVLGELFGEEGLRTLYKIYCSFGYVDFERAKARGLLKEGGDAMMVGSYLMTVYDIQGFDPKIEEASPDKVRISLYHGLPDLCPYGIGKGRVDICRATIGYEETLTKLVNPNLRAYLSKTKAAGDSVCELTIERVK